MPSITRHDPFRSIFSFPRFMEDFEDLGTSRGLKLTETEDSIVASAVVAGVPADNVDVYIEDGVLTIKAEVKEEKDKEGEHSDVSYKYYYTAALSGGQWDKAEAEVEHGVVMVTIPKAEAVRPRKISVKAKSAK